METKEKTWREWLKKGYEGLNRIVENYDVKPYVERLRCDKRFTLPIEDLPPIVRDLLDGFAEVEGFRKEYVLGCLLNAISGSTGNRLYFRVINQWKIVPCLWVMNVGNPGSGKSSCIEPIYKELRKYDVKKYSEYKEKLQEWKAKSADKSNETDKPVYSQVTLSDFTPESLWFEHHKTPQGVVVVADELAGLIESANRYSQGALISQLLQCFSGQEIKVTRKKDDFAIIISNPSVSIMGTIQPNIYDKIFTEKLRDNGFLDRWLVFIPEDDSPYKWGSETDGLSSSMLLTGTVRSILRYSLTEYRESQSSKTVEFEPTAKEYFNKIICEIQKLQHSTTDVEMKSRLSKAPIILAKLCVSYELLTRSYDKEPITEVHKEAVKAALSTYVWCVVNMSSLDNRRAKRNSEQQNVEDALDSLRDILGCLPRTFTRAEIVDVAKDFCISQRTCDRMISLGKVNGILKKIGKFSYKNVGNGNENAEMPETEIDK